MAVVAFQGELGSNSHIACRQRCEGMELLACATFEDVFAAVEEGRAQVGMVPVENTLAGHVAGIHALLSREGVYVVGEHYLRVRHALLGVRGVKLAEVKYVHSHAMALGQCRRRLQELGVEPVLSADTAGAARRIAEGGDKAHAAIAPALAADIYGLEVIAEGLEDMARNITRFLLIGAQEASVPVAANTRTSFVFQVRHVPAALYKALGGFATNGVNITRLESWRHPGNFDEAGFYADIEGHPELPSVKLALEELAFFTVSLRVLGSYEAAPPVPEEKEKP